MKTYLLDTSVIIEYLRGNQEIVALLDKIEGELESSYVCLSELYEGVCRVKNSKALEKGLLNFFEGLSVVWGLDREIAAEFGKIRFDLKKSGKVIEDLDILIAATAVANNLILVTLNKKHFEKIEGLKIYDI